MVNSGSGEMDLYALLGVEKSASQEAIRKAYRKLALKYHPDKVSEDQRVEAEAKFKSITQAYDILREEDKRRMYDQHGMAAFDPSRGGGGFGEGADINDLFSQMFAGSMPGMGRGSKGPRRSPDEEMPYKVTLEELYKGKTAKFAAEKQVICSQCAGTGAKDKNKPHKCEQCEGEGLRNVFQRMGPMLRQATVPCDICQGTGMHYKEKDRCKKCKGKRTVKENKVLELYIPRGAMQGEKVTLEGEADQHPDQQPGDLIFHIAEEAHDKFTRVGNDLSIDLDITLAESLCGFSRVVLKHLDGRGIHIDHPRGKILRPNDTIRVRGEGMPLKRSDGKGDLYLVVKVDFPEDGWLKDDGDYEALQKLLPPPELPIKAEEVDEVDYEEDADIEDMGAHQGDPRYANDWEDDKEEPGTTQCHTQ